MSQRADLRLCREDSEQVQAAARTGSCKFGGLEEYLPGDRVYSEPCAGEGDEAEAFCPGDVRCDALTSCVVGGFGIVADLFDGEVVKLGCDAQRMLGGSVVKTKGSAELQELGRIREKRLDLIARSQRRQTG